MVSGQEGMLLCRSHDEPIAIIIDLDVVKLVASIDCFALHCID
jgi:hypothetical protein